MENRPTLLIARENDRDALRRAHLDGSLIKVRRGAYLSTTQGSQPGPLDKVLAVDRQLRADHVFGHASAALVHGLRLWALPAKVHVFVRSSSSSRSARDIVRHTAPVPSEHSTVVRGLRVTTVSRTVADCAMTLPPLDALVVASDAMGRRDYDVDVALAWVRAQGRPNGTARANLVLRSALAGADSVRETWLHYLALRAGLPAPQLQVPIMTRLGRFRCDLAWPEHGVYVEYDGLVKYSNDGVRPGHDGRQELVREKRRGDAIREAGINLLRFTALDDPADITRRLLAAFPPTFRRTLKVNPLLPPLG